MSEGATRTRHRRGWVVILLGGGVLILLFVAYQLWGTDIAESHSQSVLRHRFEAELHDAHTADPDHDDGIDSTLDLAPSSTSTTVAVGDVVDHRRHERPADGGATMAAPVDGTPVGIIRIPKIGVDKVIVQGTSTDRPAPGPGALPRDAAPGRGRQRGHRRAPHHLRRALLQPRRARPGRRHRHHHRAGIVHLPRDTDAGGHPATCRWWPPPRRPELTLTTCNPRFSASRRLVVHAVWSGTSHRRRTDAGA